MAFVTTVDSAHSTSVSASGDVWADDRVGVTLLTIEGREHSGRLIDLNEDLTVARIAIMPVPPIGESVIFYLDSGLRRVAVCSRVQDGIASMRLTPWRGRSAEGRTDNVRPLRRDVDRETVDDSCVLIDPNGDRHHARVLDVSLTGLFVETEAVLHVGELVRVGRAAAEVVRGCPEGYGMRLIRPGLRPVPKAEPKMPPRTRQARNG